MTEKPSPGPLRERNESMGRVVLRISIAVAAGLLIAGAWASDGNSTGVSFAVSGIFVLLAGVGLAATFVRGW